MQCFSAKIDEAFVVMGELLWGYSALLAWMKEKVYTSPSFQATLNQITNKLDRVGPVDNRPSTDYLKPFAQKKINKK